MQQGKQTLSLNHTLYKIYSKSLGASCKPLEEAKTVQKGLSDQQVLQIRAAKMYLGWGYKKLTEHFGLTKNQAMAVISYKTRPFLEPKRSDLGDLCN